MKKQQLIGLLIIFSTIIFLVIGISSDSLSFKLLYMTLITILILYYSKLEVLNPLFWFTTAIFLYGIANSAMKILFYNIKFESELTDIDLSMLGIVIFFIIFFFCEILFHEKRFVNSFFDKFNLSERIIRIMFFLMVIYNLIFLLYLNVAGISSKLELINTGIIYSLYTNFNILYYFVIGLYFGNLIKRRKKIMFSLLLLTVLNLVVYYQTGERDIIVFPILTIFILIASHRFHRLKVIQFIPLLVLSVVSLPLLLNLGVRNGGDQGFWNFDNFLYRIFSSELISASQNLDLILNDFTFIPLGIIIPFSIIYNSFILLPGMPSLINFHGVTWFTERYYSHLPEGAGAGYSLIAEGYMFGGVTGVVVWFAFLAILLFMFFKFSQGNFVILCFYVVLLPIIIYAIRGSLETIFIYIMRILFFYLIIYFIDQIFIKKILVIKR